MIVLLLKSWDITFPAMGETFSLGHWDKQALLERGPRLVGIKYRIVGLLSGPYGIVDPFHSRRLLAHEISGWPC